MTKREISVEESMSRILATPAGSRIYLPKYGSRLMELIDKPINSAWIIDAIDYVYEALEENEPRIELKNIKIITKNKLSIYIEYVHENILKNVNIALSEVNNAIR